MRIEDDNDQLGDSKEEEIHEQRVGLEVAQAGDMLAAGPDAATWKAASQIVQNVRPVPWLLWVIIRSVYGRSGEVGNPAAGTFSAVGNLMMQAARDKTLGGDSTDRKPARNLTEAINVIGCDVAGSVCYMHAVCRRVGALVAERVWRPIVDDALLRAAIGRNIGQISQNTGPGRGMLAGFVGRSGLAIQIASGTVPQATKALGGLASGVEIGQICREIYGCDPLQVAALSLIAGGANRDIALGIAAYSNKTQDLIPGTEQFRWLALFAIIEKVRMGKHAEVPDYYWRELVIDPAGVQELMSRVQQVQRRGHGWRWITQTISEEGPVEAKPSGKEE